MARRTSKGKGIVAILGEEKKNKEKSDLGKLKKRATFYVGQKQLEKIKALAWHNREPITNIVEKAFEDFLKKETSRVKKALVSYKKADREF